MNDLQQAGFIQFDVRRGKAGDNLGKVKEGLARLDPAPESLIMLPELWGHGFLLRDMERQATETADLLAALQEEAAARSIWLAGSLTEAADDVYYNTLYLSGPQGVIGSFRKQQLFPPMGEADHFTAGNRPHPLMTPKGPMAALVCYDLRFPELVRAQASLGARILMISAQWPAARKAHWQTLLRARAIENQIFVVACNRCGEMDGIPFAGSSAVIDPWGEVLVEADHQEAAMAVSLDAGRLPQARKLFTTSAATPYRCADQDKVVELTALSQEIARLKELGRTVVFTNGCFDILHQGHVTYLEEARRQGDLLVVGMNSDTSVRSIKGPERPVNSQESRARVLAALGCVDRVVLFDDDTPLALITELLPNLLVKGADWAIDQIVGGPEVVAAGGRVVNIPMVDNFSTTSLIDKIQKSPAPEV